MLNLFPGMRLGGHRLTRRLRGGDARQVFSAVDLTDDRQEIVKVAALDSPADVVRLEREFSVLREAAGPGVVEALGHAVSLTQGMSWLVLASHGPSLAAVLAAAPGQRLPADQALAAVHAAATELGELHARHWRHGDLKPGNVLCNADGTVVLSDLEFAARLTGEDESRPHPWQLAGTPPFMAPELWRESVAAPTAAADVWALGVTLFLCLTGEYPFGHDNDQAIVAAIERGLPRELSQLPTPLGTLLTAFLEKHPAQRPADGRAAAGLIAKAAELLGIDLLVARQSFGRLVVALPKEETPAEPGTVVCGPCDSSATPSPEPPSAVQTPPPWSDNSEPRTNWPAAPSSATTYENQLRHDQEYLDISSKAVMAPPRPGSAMTPPSTVRNAPPAPAPVAAPAAVAAPADVLTPPAQLTRRAAVRWYRRMNPQHNFPLSVVISGKQIRIVGGAGLGITLGQQEIVLAAADPILSVEPWFPGCLISPPRADVHVQQENTVCRFWVTPLVCGELPEACVTIRYRGKVVETLATPATVVKRTAAKWLAALGLISPVVSKILFLAGINPDDYLRQSLPHVASVIVRLGPLGTGLTAAGVLIAGAMFHLYVTRPLLSDEPEPSLLPQTS